MDNIYLITDHGVRSLTPCKDQSFMSNEIIYRIARLITNRSYPFLNNVGTTHSNKDYQQG